MTKKDYSKNEKALKLCGSRKSGIPLFGPHELGYSCPICGSEDEVNLQWSEYADFIWCKKCNLDIPSCLCVKYGAPMIGQDPLSPKEKVLEATRIFLDCIKDAKKKCSDARKCPLTEEEH
jgi:hypothetical protein